MSSTTHPFDLLIEIDRRSRERALAGAEADGGDQLEGRLTLRLNEWNLMFALEDVVELIPVPRVTVIAGVKSWLTGIANLRGTVITIVDMSQFFGGRTIRTTQVSRVVVVRSKEWLYGLLVDEIVGMRQFGPEKRLPNLDTIDAVLRPYLTDAFHSENKNWLAFSPDRLVNDTRFLDASA